MHRARRLLLLALLTVVAVLAAFAAPALAQETTGGGETTGPGGTTAPENTGAPEEGGGGETGGCSVNPQDFRIAFIRPDQSDLSWMACPPDSYYLTYVDTRGFVGKISEMISEPAQNTYEAAQKTALNSMASSVFVFHAKAMATTLNVMAWAFGFDLISLFREQVEAITQAMEDAFFTPLLVVVYGLAVGYGAYLSIVRDQVSNGMAVIIKSAVIGSLGTLMLKQPTTVVDWYQGVVNQASGWVFTLVGEIDGNTKPGDITPGGLDRTKPLGGPGSEDRGGPDDDIPQVQFLVWERYVGLPWRALQLNSAEPDSSETRQQATELLDLKYPDDRREWLCEKAECSAFEGAPMDGGGDTGGGTTGGTTGGGDTGSGETTGEGT